MLATLIAENMKFYLGPLITVISHGPKK